MVHGIQVTKGTKVEPCEACQLGKLTRTPHPQSPFLRNTTRPLQLVVMDLAGPVKPKILGGRQYILNLFDVFTRFSWSILLKNRAEASEKILEWLPVAENESGYKLLFLRSDNGGEFTSLALQRHLAKEGVVQQTSPPYSLESNGMAERLNKTVQDKCRTMIIAAKVPRHLWGEVFEAANTLGNLTFVSNMSRTPIEKWTGHKPDLSKLRIIGSKAF